MRHDVAEAAVKRSARDQLKRLLMLDALTATVYQG
jgi:hypothetical protein